MDAERGHPRRVPSSLPLGRDTVSWHINGDPAPYLGASTALLLQVAHPLVAAGVAQHSDYASDPWTRLFRTLDTVLKLTFGPPDEVARMQQRLASRHAPVKGVSRDGVPYDARDPELGRWVWATLVHTALLCHERVYGPLPTDRRETYYQETKLFAEASGVPYESCPATWADFLAYYERTIERELARTPECLAVARSTFVLPSPPVLRHPGSFVLRFTAAALLPPRVRGIYGLNWSERRERRTRRMLRVYGAIMRVLPRRLREAPTLAVIEHDALARLERRRSPRSRGARTDERAA